MIDGIGGRLPITSAPRAATTAPVVAAAPVKPARPDLSTLATAVRDMAASPPVDDAKVARIRNALSLGTYVVDPNVIADRMIATDIDHG